MNRILVIVLGDLIAFWVSFVILTLIRFEGKEYITVINTHLFPFFILYISWALVFYIFGLYDLLSIKPTIPYIKRWILAILCSFGIGIVLFYFVSIFKITPKLNLIIQIIGFGIFSFFLRRIIYTIFSKTIIQPTILIGNSFYLSKLEMAIVKTPQIGLRIIDHLQSIKNLDLNSIKIKNLVIILDNKVEILNQDILNLYKKNIEVIDTAKAYEKYLYKIPIEYINISFIIENLRTKKDIFYKITTYIINIIFSIIVLILTSPILAVSILARLIEDGNPIFIKQKRIGLNGKIFNLYKMRSMMVLSLDGSAETDKVIWSTGINDPRITKVGKVLRKLHIDEIPQMINILKGDISLVGPRPERPEFVDLLEKEIPYYSFRHIIKPGFTGWAQIKYKYANTIDNSKEKFEYDLYYIKNRNIFIDLGILIRTIQIIFTYK